MDRFTTAKLNLTPRSDEELHTALRNFEMKWQSKARRAQDGSASDERISRF